MRRAALCLAMIVTLVAAQTSWAVPPLNPKDYPHPPKDHIHYPSFAKIRALGSVKAATIATATGTKNVAVIIVQFPAGCPHCTFGQHTIQSLANIDNYFTEMAGYYNEVSYGKIALKFSFFGPNASTISASTASFFTMSNPMEYYGCGDEGPGNACQASCSSIPTPGGGANGNYLVRDAIVAARNAGHTDLVSTDIGGIYDAVIVVHAGNGNETSPCDPLHNVPGTDGDVWSIFYSQDPQIIGGQIGPVAPAVAAGFTEGDVVPETETSGIVSPLGVMCHEFGHSLGLPDIYNTIFGTSVAGYWEIMDLGPYDDAGRHPADLSAWDRKYLGWITPMVVSSKQNVALKPIEVAGANMLQLPVAGSSQEYFLVEYRLRNSGATYDTSIPGDGLLVWHIDDGITSSRGINATNPNDQNTVNSGSPHYGVSIVPADGIFPGSNPGDSNSAFGNGHTFTSPSSDSFANQPSGISIVNIAGVGSNTVAAQVANLATAPGQSITKLINYPNPAGKGYAHPNGAGHTTLQMQLTRPASDYGFNIYTLSGDLVRRIGPSEITLNLDRSADDKWVYEFVWDLTNGDGKMVAPGVYLYLARADGKTQSNKAVIIR
jgi:M6 family metalloprotease-like protein